VLPFAVTVFLSAFLLFQVQPLISKCILPWFGGTPTVWTTCMLFFQAALLAGYTYAHLVSMRLRPRQQVILHLVVIAAALMALPIRPDARWKPEGAEDPTWRIIGLLAVTVGLPYFVLATTSPILQAWFSRANPAVSPYRLYALSNAGSLLALTTYPFLVEPNLSSSRQVVAWSAGFVFFALACAWCAARLWRTSGEAHAGAGAPEPPAVITRPPLSLQLLWLMLAASASVMLLAVTNQICQDMAVVPFLWVLPLALYLASFIICFDNERWYFRPVFWPLLIVAVAGMCWVMYKASYASLLAQVGLYCLGLFACCMVCHGELARLKPAPRYLTSFYLMIAAGGALGGVFVGLVAPLIFKTYLELHFGIWSCCALALIALWYSTENTQADRRWRRFWWPWGYAAVSVAVFGGLGGILERQAHQMTRRCVDVARNFYGVVRVTESHEYSPERHKYTLIHGGINHGWQYLHPDKRGAITSYYAERSGIGLALRLKRQAQSGLRVGVAGLGTGSIIAYGQRDDYWRFYEINPDILRLATTRFTYLRDTRARWDVVMGDARLSLERELATPKQFDILVLDAFSGDAVPVHLLTREAFAIYLQHMRPDGIIAVHISNRHLDLLPIVSGLAEHFGLRLVAIDYDPDKYTGDKDKEYERCNWVLVGHDSPFFDLEEVRAAEQSQPAQRPFIWTDDYSNLFRILRL